MHKRFKLNSVALSIQTCVYCIQYEHILPAGNCWYIFYCVKKKKKKKKKPTIVVKYMAYHIDYVEKSILCRYRTKWCELTCENGVMLTSDKLKKCTAITEIYVHMVITGCIRYNWFKQNNSNNKHQAIELCDSRYKFNKILKRILKLCIHWNAATIVCYWYHHRWLTLIEINWMIIWWCQFHFWMIENSPFFPTMKKNNNNKQHEKKIESRILCCPIKLNIFEKKLIKFQNIWNNFYILKINWYCFLLKIFFETGTYFDRFV